MKISELLENMPAKITKVKPGAEAEIDNGDGTKTIVDLKKNPSALTKDPSGKVKMAKKNDPNKKDPAKLIKPGDQVEVE